MTKIKPKPRPRITSFDSRLFANLRKANRPLPVKRLARRLDASWKTTNDHVKKLEGMRVLKTTRTVRRTNVSINPAIFSNVIRKPQQTTRKKPTKTQLQNLAKGRKVLARKRKK